MATIDGSVWTGSRWEPIRLALPPTDVPAPKPVLRGAINSNQDGYARLTFPPGTFTDFPHLKLTPVVQPAIWWADNSDRSATHYVIRAMHPDGSPWRDTWCDWEATAF